MTRNRSSSAALLDERPTIWLSGLELERLRAVVAKHLDSPDAEAAEELEAELDRALVVPPARMPPSVVRMGSSVVFEDEQGRRRGLQLVYPHEASPAHGRVSVLAPVGVALLGMPVGAAIAWPLPGGRSARLRIVEVGPAGEPGRAEPVAAP